MVLEKDLVDYPALKLHVYVRELNDSVKRAVFFTEDILDILKRITTLLMASKV